MHTKRVFHLAFSRLQRRRHHHRNLSIQNGNTYEDATNYNIPEFPSKFNFAHDIVDQWATNSKNIHHPALWYVSNEGENETKLSYSQLQSESKKLASGLSTLGSISRTMVLLPRVPEWWVVNVALARIGIIMCPGTTLLTAKDIEYRLQALKADCVIADLDCAKKIDSIKSKLNLQNKILVTPGSHKRDGWFNYYSLLDCGNNLTEEPKTNSHDLMQVYFTSGTTGNPKVVAHSHGTIGIMHQITGRFWLDLSEDDVHWNISDTGWAKSAWSNVFAPWCRGCTVFVHGMKAFHPKETLDVLSSYPITTLCAPPTLYRMWINHGISNYTFPTLRHCVSAGEPLNPEVIRQWHKHTGIYIREGYGQTETTLLAAMFKGLEVKAGSFGKPAPGFDLQIVNEKGEPLPRGKEGQIGIRVKPNKPLGLCKGYLKEDKCLELPTVGDFYLTGDTAYVDEDGYFWFGSRADDIIISSGYRISPFEVESVLLEHPSVVESAVVASPDPVRGEVVKAFVVLSETENRSHNLVENDLKNFVKQTTAAYKYPRKIEFVDSLPKTVSGKILRRQLKVQEWKKV